MFTTTVTKIEEVTETREVERNVDIEHRFQVGDDIEYGRAKSSFPALRMRNRIIGVEFLCQDGTPTYRYADGFDYVSTVDDGEYARLHVPCKAGDWITWGTRVQASKVSRIEYTDPANPIIHSTHARRIFDGSDSHDFAFHKARRLITLDMEVVDEPKQYVPEEYAEVDPKLWEKYGDILPKPGDWIQWGLGNVWEVESLSGSKIYRTGKWHQPDGVSGDELHGPVEIAHALDSGGPYPYRLFSNEDAVRDHLGVAGTPPKSRERRSVKVSVPVQDGFVKVTGRQVHIELTADPQDLQSLISLLGRSDLRLVATGEQRES